MAQTEAATRTRRRRPPTLFGGGVWTLRRVTILVLVTVFAFPFLVMLTTSFKELADIFHAPPRLLPQTWTLGNFTEAFATMKVWRYLGNTLLVSGLMVIGTLVSCPLVAYALSKVRWWGRTPLLVVVLAVMMLPPQVTMIPVYLLWNQMGAINTYWPIITPAFLGTPFLIFMIRQFLMGVPNDLIEAARLDGANELRIYWSIVLPLARPALTTAAVFQFVWAWTDFLSPLIYLTDPSKYTLSIGLYNFFSQHDVAWGPLMAACVVFTIPAVAIFLVAQRYFVGGISTGAFK
jgi:multiple sugar transport system permease protein